jgi:parallel beta-helix repeat protein
MAKKFIIFACMSLLAGIPCSADIIYVKEGGAGSGTSWDDPNGLLQIAINNANSSDEVWVAAGTYKPTIKVGGSGDRYKTFQMKNDVEIYGGFPDTGDPDMTDRDPNIYKTILNGELGTTQEPNDNCYHVFWHPSGTNLNASAILDGFVITGGNANGPGDHGSGGGMYNQSSSPTVTGCAFNGNLADSFGGGMCNILSSPTVTDCTFTGNSADHFGRGGGMYNGSSSPTVINCTFTGNTADKAEGGGMYNGGSGSPTVINCTFTCNRTREGGGMSNGRCSPTVTNCTFSGNSGIIKGGGMFNYNCSPTITNCIFTGNSSDGDGGGMYNYLDCSTTLTNCTFSGNSSGIYDLVNSSSRTVTNCIIWGNSDGQINRYQGIPPTVTYSNVMYGYTGTGNINIDPNFVDPGYWDGDNWVEGDYHLNQTAAGQIYDSPCVDAGSDTAANLGMDVFLTTRTDKVPDQGIVDMGYHYFENIADLNDSGNVNMGDVVIMALQWLQAPTEPSADIAPAPNGDNFVDYLDFGMVQQSWRWPED